MAPLPRGCAGSNSSCLNLTGRMCRPPGFWHLFRSGTGQNGSRPGYSETAGLLTRRVAMGRKGEAARRAHAVVTSLLIALLVIPLWAAWGLAPQAPLSGPIPTDPGLKVAFIGDTANGTDFRSVLTLIKSEGAHMALHQGDFDYGSNPAAFFSTIDSVLGANFPYFASTAIPAKRMGISKTSSAKLSMNLTLQ